METLAYIEPVKDVPFFLVKAKWPADSTALLLKQFNIEVTDGARFWNATIDKKHLVSSRPSGLEETVYLDMTMAAFGRKTAIKDQSMGTLALTITHDDSSTMLQWKLKQERGLQLVLGAVKLEVQSPPSDTKHPFVALVDEVISLKDENAITKKSSSELMIRNAKLEDQVASLVEQHAEWQKKVYIRFKDVLNAKKRKIRQLMTDGTKPKADKDARASPVSESIDHLGTNDEDLTEMEE